METQTETRSELAHRDFRLFLQQKLIERCEKNPRYSLRSFAKQLQINHGTLSRFLRGQRNFSEKMLKRIAYGLDVNPEEFSEFQQAKGQRNVKHYQNLTFDVFHLIADWYHDALLELPRVKSFKSQPRWIADVLGVSVNEINAAIERLERLDLIKISPSGHWQVIASDSTNILNDDYSDIAGRKYQKQILMKASEAVDMVDVHRRNNTSMTFAIDTKDLAEIKKRIARFRRELTDFVQRRSAKPDQVYQIALALFPLTDIKE